MAVRGIICAFIFVAFFNLILAAEDTDEDYELEKNARVVGRAYSLTGCDYGTQAGYTCMTCNRALHCYFGGAAIMVDCYGLFRFCRDGRCGRHQGDKCFGDNRLTTAATLLNMSQSENYVQSENYIQSENYMQSENHPQSENHLQSGITGNAQSDQASNYKPVKPISIGINLGNRGDSSNSRSTSNVVTKLSNVKIHGVDVESNLDLITESTAPVVNVDASE